MYSMYQFGQAVLQGLGGCVQPVQARSLNSVESRAIRASPLPTQLTGLHIHPHTPHLQKACSRPGAFGVNSDEKQRVSPASVPFFAFQATS